MQEKICEQIEPKEARQKGVQVRPEIQASAQEGASGEKKAANKKYYDKVKLRRTRERLRLIHGDRIDELLPERPEMTTAWFYRNR